MTNPNSIDPSMLVLKMIGGNLDGKLLPISTKKCFLTGGSSEGEEQCAIVRGPSGTAIKSNGEEILVNDHSDTLHWLSEGDKIQIGTTVMVVEQLGSFGQTVTASAPSFDEPNATKEAAPSNHQAMLDAARPEFVAPSHPSSQESEEENQPEAGQQDTGSANPIDDILASMASPTNETKAAAENSVKALQGEEDVSTTAEDTNTPAPATEPEDSAQASLQEFINQTKEASLEAPAEASEPANSPESEESPRMNNELLERALASLQQPANSPEPTEEDSHQLSTEETVDQQLDQIQDQLASQIDSYDSLPESPTSDELSLKPQPASSQPEAETTESHMEEPTSEEPVSEEPIIEPSTPVESVDEIMNRLGKSTTEPEVEEMEIPHLEVPTMDVQEETSADLTETVEPSELTDSVEAIMNRLNASTSQEPQLESATDTSVEFGSPVDQVSEEPASEEESEAVEAIMDRLAALKDETLENTDSTQDTSFPQQVSEAQAAFANEAFEAPADEVLSEETQEELPPPTPEEQSSVAAVLARMQAAGQIDEVDLEEETSFDTPTEPVVEAAPAPIAELPAVADEAEGEGGDVQDYMNQLFQRLRGSNAPASAMPQQQKGTQPTVDEPEILPPVVEPPKEKERVLTSTEYVPKQQAPEGKKDLAAMRQLANQQKSAAVATCNTKKSKVEQSVCQFIALSGVVAAAALGWLASSLTDPLALAAVVCGGVAIGAGLRFVKLKRPVSTTESKPASGEASSSTKD